MMNRKDLRRGSTSPLSHTIGGGRTPSGGYAGGNNVAFSTLDAKTNPQVGRSPNSILKRSGTDLEGSREKHRSDMMRTIKEDATAVDDNESPQYSRYGHENDGGLLNRSSKDALDDSVRNPNRPPERLPGLTDFLQDEYRHKFGIFCDDPPTLFIFWKDHVSSYYKAQREKRERLRDAMNSYAAFDQDFSSPEQTSHKMGGGATRTLQPRKASAKPKQRASSALKFEPKIKPITAKWLKTHPGYREYADCYEIDIEFTVEKDCMNRRDAQRSEELSMMNSYNQRLQQQKEKERRKAIEAILKAYYDFKLEEELEPHVMQQRRQKAKQRAADKKAGLTDAEIAAREEKRRKASIDAKKKAAAAAKQQKQEEKKRRADSALKQGKKFVPESSSDEYSATEDEAETSAKVIGIEKNKTELAAEKLKRKKELDAKKAEDRKHLWLAGMGPKRPQTATNAKKVGQGLEQSQEGPSLAALRRGPTKLDLLEAEADSRFFSTAQKKWENERIEMEAVLKMVAKVPLKAGVDHVKQAYQANKHLAKLNIPGGDDVVTRRLNEFFSKDNMVLRLALYKDRVNKSRRKGDVTLLIYYTNCKPEERLNNFFAMRDKEEAKAAIEAYEEKLRNRFKTEDEKAQEKAEKNEQKKRINLYQKVFGPNFDPKTGLKLENRAELTEPKDKHGVRSTLFKLKGQFQHEQILHRMLKNELADDQPFKYPEEYQLFDDATEKAFKKNFVKERYVPKVPDPDAEAKQLEYFQQKDEAEHQGALRVRGQEVKKIQALERFLQQKALEYNEWRKKRGNAAPEDKRTQRDYLAEIYAEMLKEHGEVAKARFPHHAHLVFGADIKQSETMAKSYPTEFKNYFYKLVNACVQVGKGKVKFAKVPPSLLMMVGARQATLADTIQAKTQNKRLAKFAFGQIVKKMKKGDPKAWRSRVFKREDMKKKLRGIFMQFGEVDNCTFEPEISEPPPYARAAAEDADRGMPGAFVKRMGTDFSKSDPSIYKFGKIRRAKTHLRAGDVEQCIKKLVEGFDLCLVYMKFRPAEYKLWADHRRLAKEQEKVHDKQQLQRQRTLQKAVDPASDDLTGEQLAEVKAAFASADTKKLGYIKFSDLDLAMRHLGIDPHPLEIKEFEDRLGLDGKKNIIYEDFLGLMTKKLKETESAKDLEDAFKIFDEDGSGEIDAEEFKHVLENLGCNFSPWEIDEMLKAADADGNGKVSEEEFVAVMQSKRKKLDGVDYKAVMREQLRRYIQRQELKKKFARIGTHVPALLNKFADEKDRIMDDVRGNKERENEKRSVYAEKLDEPGFQALYAECWDLVQELFKRKEKEEKHRTYHETQEKALRHAQLNLPRQLQDGFDPETDKKDYRKLFKTIMCPLRDECPQFSRLRWPQSKDPTTKRVGHDCPYAHHPMELQFPQSLSMRVKGNKESMKRDINAPLKYFARGGELYDCRGCARCNMCMYKADAQKVINSMTEKVLNRKDTNKDRVAERKKQNDAQRSAFAVKFGHLKKASVLLFYGRQVAAFDEINKAVDMIKQQEEKDKETNINLQKHWQEKLRLPEGFELPKPIETIRKEDLTEEFIKSIDTGSQTDLATMRLYLENVCPLVKSQYNRDVFLNGEIMRFRIKVDEMLHGKMSQIEKTKKNIEELQQAAELLEGLGSDIDKEENQALLQDDDGKPLRVPKMRKKMCESVQKRVPYKDVGIEMADEEKYFVDAKINRKITHDANGAEICTVCPKGKSCPHAHNAIQLNMYPLAGKIKNLQALVKSQNHVLKNDKPQEPWRPSAKNFDVSKLPDDNAAKKKNPGKEDEEAKKRSILDRSNIFRKPWDKDD